MSIAGMRIRSHEYFGLERRVVAHKTMEAWDNIPHAGVILDYDVTKILDMVAALRRSPAFAGTRLTINTVMLKIIAEGVKRSPAMNAHTAYRRCTGVGTATCYDTINIAIPFLTEARRTITPVVRDSGGMTLRELCHALEDMKRRVANTDIEVLLRSAAWRDAFERLRRFDLTLIARFWGNVLGPGRLPVPARARVRAFNAMPESERVTADDLMSATLLVSNLGSVLPDFSCYPCMLEVIPPQSAAIGLGAVAKRPVVRTNARGEDEIVVRKMMPMAVIFDHRLLDFEHTLGFFEALREFSETPGRLLTEDEAKLCRAPAA